MTRTARITTGGRSITESTATDNSTTENESQQNLTGTTRPKRGQKQKKSSAETAIQQVPIVQPVAKRGRPKKTAQISEEPTNVTTEINTNDSNNKGKKRKAITEDNNGEVENQEADPAKQNKKTKTKTPTEKKTTKKPAKKKATKKPKEPEEKRLARTRLVCPAVSKFFINFLYANS
jgi:hypothetical protein